MTNELTKLEAERAACYDGKGGCNYRKLRKIDKAIRAAAIRALGMKPEATGIGPFHADAYCASTGELVRWARTAACEHDFDTVTNKCARCGLAAPVEA